MIHAFSSAQAMQTVPADGVNGLMTSNAAPNLLPQVVSTSIRRGKNTPNHNIGADNGPFSQRSPVSEESYRYES